MKGTTTFLSTFLVVAVALVGMNPRLAESSPFTPLEWKEELTPQSIDKYHIPPSFIGQQKHLAWDRDTDHDFIDDEIKVRFKPDQLVNVIVDLNQNVPPSKLIPLLSKFGNIAHIGKLVSFVVLNDVTVKMLPKLASLPIVAMIEWHTPIYPLNSNGTRAIEARKSITYPGSTAEDKGLTGAGVNVAIVDTGVDNRHKAFRKAGHYNDAGPCVPSNTRFVAGYDATVTSYQTMISCTSRDFLGHGTHVAGTVLGLPTPTAPAGCLPLRSPDNTLLTDCGGVAPAAGLVDVKVCNGASPNPCPFLEAGLDWVEANYQTRNIRVVNISLGEKCRNDTYGTGARAVQVNALVSLGVVVVIAHGNADPEPDPPYNTDPPYCNVGQRLTSSPGSAGLAMTVSATENQNVANYSITRTDDIHYNGGLSGPRNDFPSNPPEESLKPDFSAPGMNIVSASVDTLGEYDGRSGTSMAAPFVAGAAALIIEARPTILPFALKDLLRRTADKAQNGTPYAAGTDPTKWESRLGSGMITVGQALSELTQDIGFPSCVGPPAMPGGPCQLSGMVLNNEADITIDTIPVQHGVPNTIRAKVHNSGALPATVFVRFGTSERIGIHHPFNHIGTVRVEIPANGIQDVPQTWTPMFSDIQNIRVSIQYGMDSNFDNNVTQLSQMILPLVFEARENRTDMPLEIENPFPIRSRFEIHTKPNRGVGKCRISEDVFELDPSEDPPKTLRVILDTPARPRSGERVGCTVAIYATPEGAEKPILIGEVNVQSLPP